MNIMYFFFVTSSPILALSSSTWFNMWMMLELNMITFIPLILQSKNILSNEAALKYFLIQASSSVMMIMFCVLNSFSYWNFSSFQYYFLSNFLITLPLMIKLGAAPFQAWFISVMLNGTWLMCLLLSTWQKIIPLMIVGMIHPNHNSILIFSTASLIAGALGGLTQTSLQKILAFSSINHMGWLFVSLLLSKINLLYYFFFYFLMNLSMILSLNQFSIFQFNQNYWTSQIIPFSMIVLSLGGLPPFMGFMPKWLIIQSLTSFKSFFLPLLMFSTSLITLYFYLRLTFNNLILVSFTNKWMIPFSFLFKPLNLLNMILLILTLSTLSIFNLILT